MAETVGVDEDQAVVEAVLEPQLRTPRNRLQRVESQDETIASWLEELTGGTLDAYAARGAHPEDWDLGGLTEALHRQFDTRVSPAQYAEDWPVSVKVISIE